MVAEQEQSSIPVTDTETDEQRQLRVEKLVEGRRKLGNEVEQKYRDWRELRKPYEFQWFVTAAYKRGKQSNDTPSTLEALTQLSKVSRKRKNIANKLWAKHRARYAKFARTRPKPIVISFGSDRKARLDARASERALDYFYGKAEQEQKYYDAVLKAGETGKSYWWVYFDPSKPATILQKNDLTGTTTYQDVSEAGEVTLEVGSAWEVLVPNLALEHIKDQPEFMRVRVKDVEEMKLKHPDFADYIKSDSHHTSPFEFERQVAHLSGNEIGALASMSSEKGKQLGVIVKELYTKPSLVNPHGKYSVVMNGIAVRTQDELPLKFWDLENPYPCAEFVDMPNVGQFYAPTFLEQLIPLQRGYNVMRDKAEQHVKKNVHPKWIVTKQARIPKGALTNDADEVVEWNFIPGMPEPHTVTPGAIGSDIWRMAQLLSKEFDEVSQIQPSFEGRAGSSKSGIQTNLLQEASDSVHSPDARGFELAVLDASYKIRRLMKEGYTESRVFSFSGRHNTPEVFEFSSENIDEHASIVIQVGSALSTFKSARIQQLTEMYEKGMLGDPANPEVRRRVLAILDIGGLEQFQEEARMDEDMARLENIDLMASNLTVPVPMFYENHMVHYATHAEELKSPANKNMDPNTKKSFIVHMLLHLKWFNPVSAYNLAMELGLTELVESGAIKPPAPQPTSGGPGPNPPLGGPVTPTP